MDRPLDSATQRRARLRRTSTIALPLAGLAAVLVLLPGWIRPSVSRSRIRTAIVTAGPIESVITASGTIAPEIERVLSSPLDARVLRVLKRPGTSVKHGEPVVVLDVSQSVLSLEKVVKDAQLKDNQQAQTRLTLEKSLRELDGRIELKTLELESLISRSANQRRLFDEGLVSRDGLRQAELDVKQADIALLQLTADRVNTQRATDLQFAGLGLERAALDKEVVEARRLLDLATAKSDRDGVVTWALPQEGALVRRGDVIARIADLSSYRVDASVSDIHAGQLRAGAPCVIKVNDLDLNGAIAEILPSVEGGTIGFTVALQQRSHPVLRPNMRVDVLIVTGRRPRARRVKRGPFADVSGEHEAFVVRGDRAVRVTLNLGLTSFDEVEIVSGAGEGDEVLISDMREYLHLKEIALR
jgi:HlyD family secretion protein